jgi:transcriptional regulator with XRE-family HTH domain
MAALRDLGEFIREQRRNARISLRQLAEQAGVSNPYLSQIERGLRKPSAEVLQQIANALRVSTPIMYLRAGLLEAREGQGVPAAIAADDALTARQKQTLTEIYEAFRRENARSDPNGAASRMAGPGSDSPSHPPAEAAAQPASPGEPAAPGEPVGQAGQTAPGAEETAGSRPATRRVRKVAKKASSRVARKTPAHGHSRTVGADVEQAVDRGGEPVRSTGRGRPKSAPELPETPDQ